MLAMATTTAATTEIAKTITTHRQNNYKHGCFRKLLVFMFFWRWQTSDKNTCFVFSWFRVMLNRKTCFVVWPSTKTCKTYCFSKVFQGSSNHFPRFPKVHSKVFPTLRFASHFLLPGTRWAGRWPLARNRPNPFQGSPRIFQGFSRFPWFPELWSPGRFQGFSMVFPRFFSGGDNQHEFNFRPPTSGSTFENLLQEEERQVRQP